MATSWQWHPLQVAGWLCSLQCLWNLRAFSRRMGKAWPYCKLQGKFGTNDRNRPSASRWQSHRPGNRLHPEVGGRNCVFTYLRLYSCIAAQTYRAPIQAFQRAGLCPHRHGERLSCLQLHIYNRWGWRWGGYPPHRRGILPGKESTPLRRHHRIGW